MYGKQFKRNSQKLSFINIRNEHLATIFCVFASAKLYASQKSLKKSVVKIYVRNNSGNMHG